MDLQLRQKIALVAGGSRGIGKAIAAGLAAEGCDVALLARDAAVAHEAAAEIAAASGRRVAAYPADTTNGAQLEAAVAAILADFGQVDILVNCAATPAGQAAPPKLDTLTEGDFWAELNTKVLGYIRLIQLVAPQMRARGWGRIINISGLAARQTGSIIGSMRNVSVSAMTKNVAEELAGTGINVTCVHPGFTRTEKTPGVLERFSKAAGITPAELEERYRKSNLAQHFISAAEIANVVVFLASPCSIAINGDSIAAGGGAPGSIHY